MGISVQELKHAARLQEWSARVAECRSSGIGVKAWCAEQGIALKTYYNWEKQIVKAATQQYALPGPAQTGLPMQVNHALIWQHFVQNPDGHSIATRLPRILWRESGVKIYKSLFVHISLPDICLLQLL